MMFQRYKRTRLLVTTLQIGIVIGFSGSTFAQAALPEPVESAALRAVWSTLDAAWNQRDVQRFSSLFTDDGSFVFVDRDDWLGGREAIQERFAVQFPKTPPDLRHLTEVQRYRMIAPDVAAIDGTVAVLRPVDDAEPAILRSFAIFAVMVQEKEEWKIRDLRIYQLPVETGGNQ